MDRVAIDGGGWYDLDSARVWEDRCVHDGRNFVHTSTGGQWCWQEVHRTARGAWVLVCGSQWQGSRTSRERISPVQAAQWLLRYGRVDQLPNELDAYASAGEV